MSDIGSRSLRLGWNAGGALAAVGLDELIHIFWAVVVGELFARLDVLQGLDEYLFADLHGFAVGFAGVVHVARGVVAR